MVQYPHARLDDTFAALSDVTRRGVLEQLGRSDASKRTRVERALRPGDRHHAGAYDGMRQMFEQLDGMLAG